jgi:hypothetical protein
MSSVGPKRRVGQDSLGTSPCPAKSKNSLYTFYRVIWTTVNALLIASIALTVYSIGWEYSTRRYLKGFADAIVPATSAADVKITAILDWMAHGPARQDSTPGGIAPERDPTDTLNYDALLRVCGTATNAFINLADVGGLPTRRLLLLDSKNQTKHVVAETLVDGRWIVVDATFRVVFRGPDGQPLTREQMTDPGIFSQATRNIYQYDPNYTYDHTAHVHLARFGFLAPALQGVLGRVLSGWESAAATSALLERESLAACFASINLVILLGLLRICMRWLAERYLGISRKRVRKNATRALREFLEIPADSLHRRI